MALLEHDSARVRLCHSRLPFSLTLFLSPYLPLSLPPSLRFSLNPHPQEKLSSSPLCLWLTTPPSLSSNHTLHRPTQLARSSLLASPPPLTTITTVTLAPSQSPTIPYNKCTAESLWSPWNRTTMPPPPEVSISPLDQS